MKTFFCLFALIACAPAQADYTQYVNPSSVAPTTVTRFPARVIRSA
jgi:hypothetical protein